MRSLPLFKFGDRARSTSWGIALCTMFIVASFSIAGGLETSMDKLAGNFSSDRYLVTLPGDAGPEFIPTSSLEPFAGRIATGTCLEALVVQYNESVTVFCISDQYGVLPEQFYVREKEVLVGPALAMSGDITLVTNNTVNASIDGRFSSSFFPPSWMFAREDLVQDLTGRAADNYNFVVARGLNATEIGLLEEQGFVVQPLIGIIDFLSSGAHEIKNDAVWFLVPSAFVIAVLAYSFIGSETADRRHDIGIVKTLGAGRKRVLGYLMLNALVISAWGGLLGVALGVVLSYALSTAASAMFTSIFMIETSEILLTVSFLATVGAGVLGAFIPAVKMTLTSPVQDLKEVAPFS
jgi:hypothetical protein